MLGSWVRAPVGSQKVVRLADDFFCFRPRGEIGRLAILRGWCRKTCQFESDRGHFYIKNTQSSVFFYFTDYLIGYKASFP